MYIYIHNLYVGEIIRSQSPQEYIGLFPSPPKKHPFFPRPLPAGAEISAMLVSGVVKRPPGHPYLVGGWYFFIYMGGS